MSQKIKPQFFHSRNFFSEDLPFAIFRTVDLPEDFNLSKRFLRDFWKITLVISGKGNLVAGDKKYPVAKDSLMIIHPDTRSTWEINSPGLQIFNIVFSRSFLTETLNGIHDKYDFLQIFSDEYHQELNMNLFLMNSNPQIKSLIRRIYEEYENHQNNRGLFLKVYFAELLLLIVRQSEQKGNRNPAWTAFYLREYLCRHFREDFSQRELAEKLQISPERLCRIYREFHGSSIMHDLQDLRMNHAAALLKNGNLSIQEICRSSGYRDLRLFYKAFTKKFSVPPSKFRSMVKN